MRIDNFVYERLYQISQRRKTVDRFYANCWWDVVCAFIFAMKKKSITEMFEEPLRRTFEEATKDDYLKRNETVTTESIPYHKGIKKLTTQQLKDLIKFAENEIDEYDSFIIQIVNELQRRKK